MVLIIEEDKAPATIYAFDQYLKGQVSRGTRAKYVRQIRRFLTNYHPYTEDVNRYLTNISARRDARAAFKKYFEYLDVPHYYQLIKKVRNPPKTLRGVFLNKELIRSMIEYIDKKHFKIVALIQFDSGRRISEVLGINRENIELLPDGSVNIYAIAKGDKEDYFYVTKETGRKLMDYLKEQRLEYPFLLSRSRNKEVSIATNAKYYRLALKKAAKQAGIKDFRPHDFRRNFANDMYRILTDNFIQGKIRDEPLRALRSLMGHRSISTTEVYLDEIRQDMKVLVEEARGKREDI